MPGENGKRLYSNISHGAGCSHQPLGLLCVPSSELTATRDTFEGGMGTL